MKGPKMKEMMKLAASALIGMSGVAASATQVVQNMDAAGQ